MRTGTASGRPRRLTRVGAVAVLAWVVAVVVGSTIAWRALAVVDSGESTGVLSQSEVAAALAEAGPPATSVTPTPSETAPTATPQSTATTAPPASTTAPTTPAPRSTSAPAPAPPVPTTAEVARTWTVAGGVVAVSCRGGAITLLYATPSDGWTVEVGSPGPEHVEVELRRDEAETKLTGTCVAGVPDSRVDSEDDSSGGGSDDRGSDKVQSSATDD